MRRAVQALLLTVALLCGGSAWGHASALLIGVSGYPSLDERLRLKGPANDVQRLRDVLVRRGVAIDRITVLADGVPGAASPTRANILQALERLAIDSQPGDTVVVHFSGHGSREPAPDGGLRPIFLPLDIGRWDGRAGRVANAVGVDELRDRIDRMANRGAFVWGIFDSCHSAGLVRGEGDDELSLRGVRPADLGIPDAAFERDAGGQRARGAAPVDRDLAPIAGARQRGGTVFFYAAQPGEVTLQLLLPKGALFGRRHHGVFTYVVSRALEEAHRASYRQLGQFVRATYAAFDQALPTPEFSGDALDTPALGALTQNSAQWPLLPGSTVDVGLLSGVAPGAVFAVVRGPLASDEQRIGHLRVVSADAARARLEPVAYAGQAAPDAAALDLPQGLFVRLVQRPLDGTLRVAFDARGCEADCPLRRAVQRLVAGRSPGFDLRWVEPGAGPDILLRRDGSNLVFLSSLQTAGVQGASPGAALPLSEQGRPVPVEWLSDRIGTALHLIARARSLSSLAARYAAEPDPNRLSVRLRRRGGQEVVLSGERVPMLRDKEVLTLELFNNGAVALDATVLYVQADHGINALFPNGQLSINRIEPGQRRVVDDIRISAPPSGLEQMVVIVGPALPGMDRADFSMLVQPPVQGQRGVGEDLLQALVDEASAGMRTRSDKPAWGSARGVSMQLYTLNVQP